MKKLELRVGHGSWSRVCGWIDGKDIKRVFLSGNEKTTICRGILMMYFLVTVGKKKKREKEKKREKPENESKINGAGGVWDWFLGDALGGSWPGLGGV